MDNMHTELPGPTPLPWVFKWTYHSPDTFIKRDWYLILTLEILKQNSTLQNFLVGSNFLFSVGFNKALKTF